MATNKCNKCLHQAVVKFEDEQLTFCLALEIQLKKAAKNCTEFVDTTKLQEPEMFEEELDSIIEKPSKRKINKLKKQIKELRDWGYQNNKPKMRRENEKSTNNASRTTAANGKRKRTSRSR
jgi:hypothetical protein